MQLQICMCVKVIVTERVDSQEIIAILHYYFCGTRLGVAQSVRRMDELTGVANEFSEFKFFAFSFAYFFRKPVAATIYLKPIL